MAKREAGSNLICMQGTEETLMPTAPRLDHFNHERNLAPMLGDLTSRHRQYR